MTVAIHELGHALGMGHSTDSAAAMYPAYTTTKQAVTADDIGGIRTIYNSRQNDFFDANGANDTASTADDISSYIDANGQLTTLGAGFHHARHDRRPTTSTGTRSRFPPRRPGRWSSGCSRPNLSLLAPTLAVYNSAGTTMLGQQISYNMGDTVTVTINNVSPGQVYDIRCQGSTTGDSGFGAYGLQVNFGSLTQPPITPPNTTMAGAPTRAAAR